MERLALCVVVAVLCLVVAANYQLDGLALVADVLAFGFAVVYGLMAADSLSNRKK